MAQSLLLISAERGQIFYKGGLCLSIHMYDTDSLRPAWLEQARREEKEQRCSSRKNSYGLDKKLHLAKWWKLLRGMEQNNVDLKFFLQMVLSPPLVHALWCSPTHRNHHLSISCHANHSYKGELLPSLAFFWLSCEWDPTWDEFLLYD
jgi:hypothetical protein